MSTIALRCTLHPPVELWFPPGPPPGAEVMLIGWVQDVTPPDEGVPGDVVEIATRAITRDYRMTYIDGGAEKSAEWKDSENGRKQSCFLKATQFSPIAGYGLTSTCDAEVAVDLFSTDEWLWHLQSQWVFLTRRTDPPPHISFPTLHQVAQARRLDSEQLQAEFACRGIMAPGPDGDFMQFVLWQPGAMAGLLTNLQAQAELARLPWAEVSELEFRETQWLSSEVRS